MLFSGLCKTSKRTVTRTLSSHSVKSWAFPSWPIVPSTRTGQSAKGAWVASNRSESYSALSTKSMRSAEHRLIGLPSCSKTRLCSSTWLLNRQGASHSSSSTLCHRIVKLPSWRTWSAMKIKESSWSRIWMNSRYLIKRAEYSPNTSDFRSSVKSTSRVRLLAMRQLRHRWLKEQRISTTCTKLDSRRAQWAIATLSSSQQRRREVKPTWWRSQWPSAVSIKSEWACTCPSEILTTSSRCRIRWCQRLMTRSKI